MEAGGGGVGGGGGWRLEAASLLCKVRSDGEAGRPQCRHAKHRLDGGPRAAEDRVPLPVVEIHKGLLHGHTERGGEEGY